MTKQNASPQDHSEIPGQNHAAEAASEAKQKSSTDGFPELPATPEQRRKVSKQLKEIAQTAPPTDLALKSADPPNPVKFDSSPIKIDTDTQSRPPETVSRPKSDSISVDWKTADPPTPVKFDQSPVKFDSNPIKIDIDTQSNPPETISRTKSDSISVDWKTADPPTPVKFDQNPVKFDSDPIKIDTSGIQWKPPDTVSPPKLDTVSVDWKPADPPTINKIDQSPVKFDSDPIKIDTSGIQWKPPDTVSPPKLDTVSVDWKPADPPTINKIDAGTISIKPPEFTPNPKPDEPVKTDGYSKTNDSTQPLAPPANTDKLVTVLTSEQKQQLVDLIHALEQGKLPDLDPNQLQLLQLLAKILKDTNQLPGTPKTDDVLDPTALAKLKQAIPDIPTKSTDAGTTDGGKHSPDPITPAKDAIKPQDTDKPAAKAEAQAALPDQQKPDRAADLNFQAAAIQASLQRAVQQADTTTDLPPGIRPLLTVQGSSELLKQADATGKDAASLLLGKDGAPIDPSKLRTILPGEEADALRGKAAIPGQKDSALAGDETDPFRGKLYTGPKDVFQIGDGTDLASGKLIDRLMLGQKDVLLPQDGTDAVRGRVLDRIPPGDKPPIDPTQKLPELDATKGKDTESANDEAEKPDKDDEEKADDTKKPEEDETDKKEEETAESDKTEEPPPEEPKEEEEEQRQKYKVRLGDTLESIASKKFDDRRLAPLIYEINENTIPARKINGKRVLDLRPKMVIYLPTTKDITEFRGRFFNWGQPDFEYVSYSSGMRTAEQELSDWQQRLSGFEEPHLHQEATAKLDQALPHQISSTQTPEPDAIVDPVGTAEAIAAAQIRQSNIEKLFGVQPSDKKDDPTRIHYIVRIGDTLRSIATKHPALKDVHLWELLATTNNLPIAVNAKGIPLATIKRGTTLMLPNANEIEAFRQNQQLRRQKAEDYVRKQNPPNSPSVLSCPQCGCTLELRVVSNGNKSDDQAKTRADQSPAKPDHSESSTATSKSPHTEILAEAQEAKARAQADRPNPYEGAFIENLSHHCRLVKSSSADGGINKTSLEIYEEGNWKQVVAYEISEEVSVRHEFARNGDRRSTRVNMPPDVVQKLADHELSSNWHKYNVKFRLHKRITEEDKVIDFLLASGLMLPIDEGPKQPKTEILPEASE